MMRETSSEQAKPDKHKARKLLTSATEARSLARYEKKIATVTML